VFDKEAWRQKPEVKQKAREYARRPEVRERQNARARAWRATHREESIARLRAYQENRSEEATRRAKYDHKLYTKEQNHLLKVKAVMHYANPKGTMVCNDCGEQDIDVLCLDHIAGGGGEHRQNIGIFGSRFYRWLEQRDYPEGFQDLCYNCNMKKEKYKLG